MYSFGFPKMLNTTSSNMVSDKEAVRSNMVLLLSSECETLFGDPYFGCTLKKYMFEHINSLAVDLLIDELYTAITTFMPQIFVNRKDIIIRNSRTELFAEIKYYYLPDNTTDLVNIKLTESSEE